jgi:hypothetical protein
VRWTNRVGPLFAVETRAAGMRQETLRSRKGEGEFIDQVLPPSYEAAREALFGPLSVFCFLF